MRCCADDETTPHWRFYCVGNAASDAREVRAQLKRDLNEVLEKLGDVGWAHAWGVTRATCQETPWESAPEAEEHRPERGRVTHKGGTTTLRGEGEPVTISRAAYEKTRRLWTHGWEVRGEAFVNAAAEAHRWIQDGMETGRHTRRKKMCWANDETYEDIRL